MLYDPKRDPTLENLIHALRNLPDDFEWNYSNCDHCAIGLAERLWPHTLRRNHEMPAAQLSRLLKIDYSSAVDIFVRGNRGLIGRRTKPHQIAKALERLLERA